MMSCSSNTHVEQTSKDSIVIINNDTVSLDRLNPSKDPIATYSEAVGDNVNNANHWKFAVNIFETKNTFNFLVKIKYKEINEMEAIGIPNFGIFPTVVTQKGSAPLSCIIGFLDKKGAFKPYKKVCVEKDQLKIITINKYAVSVYKQTID